MPNVLRGCDQAAATRMLLRCVEHDAELVGVAADLREEEPALDAGHSAGGERGGVGVFAQLATGSHASEAVAQVRFPRCEAGGGHRHFHR